jgi:hypothetical protein
MSEVNGFLYHWTVAITHPIIDVKRGWIGLIVIGLKTAVVSLIILAQNWNNTLAGRKAGEEQRKVRSKTEFEEMETAMETVLEELKVTDMEANTDAMEVLRRI